MGSSMRTMEWKFSQVFGERQPGEKVEEIDTISAVEFDSEGDYLATGDHGGRVVLFERTNGNYPCSRKELEHIDSPVTLLPLYRYKTEFQSHDIEFDYLKSLEIGEKINKLRWCTCLNNSLLILSMNDRTIKLWKVSDHKVKKAKEVNSNAHVYSENALLSERSFMSDHSKPSVPNGYPLEWDEWVTKKSRYISPTVEEGPHVMLDSGKCTSSRCRRVYSHAHDYNINSISINSDCETFLSADDLRINIWNLEVSNQCFNITDMKPLDMEDLVEVITSAEFHPVSCNLLAYSSSRGFIRLVDMRQSALCDQNARILQDREAHGSRSFFTEIAGSISDIKFAKDGRHILSRDYMNLKLWDLRMESSPVISFKIHEYLRPKLSELYNGDFIFDKFDCCISKDGCHFATGTYSNIFSVFCHDGGHIDGITLEASKNPNRISHNPDYHKHTGLFTSFACGFHRRGHENSSLNNINDVPCDLNSKLMHLAWHPTKNLIACAAKCSLYIYYA
ncbi:serine/threonine protein phosphatase [Canna indica]|uniref:Serine/threonine-protein phosphatase 2A 55 kDa regulatory subunit B n=1 Tax=Canna indica TaxID=4628 RepID=A0AAQ3QPN3_9LILI|nr:serine/threonine protein phosphatase [Canna indica]